MKPVAKIDLPDDVEQLKKLLLKGFDESQQLQQTHDRLQKSLDRSLKKNDLSVVQLEKNLLKKNQKIEQLEEIIRYLKHSKFGRSSEKFEGKHQDLFNEAEELLALQDLAELPTDEAVAPVAKTSKPKSKPRTLQKLPDDIPRTEVFHDLSDAEKDCACGCQMTKSGSERSEQLNIAPPQFSITVNVRHTYACAQCDGKLKTAKKPAQAIEKSFASASLLAYIITSKYLYALPLYRQERMYESLKVPLKRNTMANWVIKGSDLVVPLIDRFEEYLLRKDYLQCDESRLQVLNEPDREASQVSQMWVRRSTGDRPIILFDYSPSRSGEQACSLLKDFSGYLQTDDYAGYNKIVKQNQLIALGCNAHARRKFDEAMKSEPKGGKATKNKSPSGAAMGLIYYKKLYQIETQIKDLSTAERFQIRVKKSVPIMKAFVAWAEKMLLEKPKSGKLGTALSYLVRNQSKLIQYCGHGKLNIDNNLAEGAIRPFVIGRKNFLFSDSVAGAHASARLYSLVETAKAHQLNVFDYLTHVFEVLPGMTSEAELDALLPWNVKLPD